MSYLNLKLGILLLCLTTYNGRKNSTEDWFKLEFIHDFPIKIDGGCSFYTFDTTDLSKEKYILVVDKDRLAFIQTNGKYEYLSHRKRILQPNGYKDFFSNATYKIALVLRKVKTLDDGRNEFKGSLIISNNNKSKVVAVHGINEEHPIKI